MKRIMCVAIGVVMDIPDDESTAGVPSPINPLDELAACLRGKTTVGCGKHQLPGATARMSGAFQESPNRN
jgi:hypothetical protein